MFRIAIIDDEKPPSGGYICSKCSRLGAFRILAVLLK